jgi:zinc protease
MKRRPLLVVVIAPTLTAALTVGTAAVLTVVPAAAQVTTHPREMGLVTPASPRPDPQAHRIELPGGVVAYGAVDRTAPLVTLTTLIGAGYVDGPEGAAEVLVHGLRTHGPAGLEPGAFQQMLRSMTADYSVTLGPEGMEVSLEVPAEDTWQALALLADLIRRGPALGEQDVRAFRTDTRGALLSDVAGGESGPVLYEGSLAGAADLFRRHVLGGTAYGHALTPDDVDGLTLNEVRAFHRSVFVAGNVVLAAAGPLEMADLRQALDEGFGGMERGPRYERGRTAAPMSAQAPQVFTYPADKLQGWLVIGHELPVVPRQDEAALQVMNYILGGGHFDTRLFRATRDRRGLTNDDSGFLEANRDGPGTYAFHTYGRPETVRLLLHLTLAEIERIRSGSVTEEELFVAKGALADGVFSARYRDGWTTARTLAAEWLAHGSHEASETYQSRIRSVTAADVLEAARTYLDPDRMQVILVGPIDAIEAAPALEDEGPLADYGRLVRGG